MPVPKEYESDLRTILGKQHENGADFWATPDGRWGKGSPFSTFDCALMLHELGLSSSHEAVRGALDLVLAAWRDDGRIRLAPRAPLYPCYTAEAARVLCRFGYSDDERLARTASYFIETGHETGGWRCNFTKFGRGSETTFANPGATLFVLDVLRFTESMNVVPEVNQAVESLLEHWEVRKPLGPCHYGIGSLFRQVEYPFLRYNLFFYVYVLSFYDAAKRRTEFRRALEALQAKLTDGAVVVENPNRGLAKLAFCRKGEPSGLATKRYREILAYIGA